MSQQLSRREIVSLLVAASLGGCLEFTKTDEDSPRAQELSPQEGANRKGTTHTQSTDRRTASSPWEFSMKAPATTTPLVRNNTVYIGSMDHHLYGIDVTSGKERFSTDVGDEVGPGIVYNSGIIYGAGPSGIFGIDGASGELVLNLDQDVGNGIHAPLVHDQTLYYPFEKLLAFNRETGELQWTKQSPSVFGGQPKQTAGVLVTSDAGDTDTLPSNKSIVYGLNPDDGSTRWRRHIEQDSLVSPVSISQEHEIAVLGGRYGMLAAFDVASGDELWRTTVKKGGNVPFWPSAIGNAVYLPMRGEQLRAYDIRTGELLWSKGKDSDMQSGWEVKQLNDRLYTSTQSDVYEVDPSTGDLLAKHQLSPSGTRRTGVALTKGGIIYPTETGEVHRISRKLSSHSTTR